MNLTLSPQLRLIAVAGLAMLALVMAALFLMTRAQLAAQDDAAPVQVVERPAAPAQTPAVPATPTKPAAKPAAVKRTIAMRLAAQKRLPYTIARELGDHRVVVAVLVVPDASLDTTVLAEARAAAEQAKVGFVAVNVLHERAGRSLAERLGVVETPAVIVYRRPAKAFLKLEGFADRDTVVQAIANARGR